MAGRRSTPKPRPLSEVVAAAFKAAGFLASALALVFKFALGGPPAGPAGEILGFLWRPVPFWSHGITLAVALGAAVVVDWLRRREAPDTLPSELAASTLEIQQFAILARDAQARSLAVDLRRVAREKTEIVAANREMTDRLAALFLELESIGDDKAALERKVAVLTQIAAIVGVLAVLACAWAAVATAQAVATPGPTPGEAGGAEALPGNEPAPTG